MTGREDVLANNLFFLCSLIEYIARYTKNKRSIIVNAIGEDKLKHYFDLADVYHSENMDKLRDEIIEKCKITTGIFDNVQDCKYIPPTYFDIAKVYKRLIIAVAATKKINYLTATIEVYNSWISEKIDNYNSSLFYENPDFLYNCYKENKIFE